MVRNGEKKFRREEPPLSEGRKVRVIVQREKIVKKGRRRVLSPLGDTKGKNVIEGAFAETERLERGLIVNRKEGG